MCGYLSYLYAYIYIYNTYIHVIHISIYITFMLATNIDTYTYSSVVYINV